jgi:hypothetical protein
MGQILGAERGRRDEGWIRRNYPDESFNIKLTSGYRSHDEILMSRR